MSEWSDRHERELSRLEDELNPVLQTVMVSAPKQKETQELLGSLAPLLQEQRQSNQVWQQHKWRKQPSLWRQMKTQAKMYGWPFWTASIIGFALITLSMLNMDGVPVVGEVSPLFHFAPLILLISLIYGYRTWDSGMRMVESVTVFPPVLMVLSRFLVVLVFDIALTLMSSVYVLLAVEPSSTMIHPFLFVLYALAPLTFYFGVIAYTMLYRGVKTGFITGGVLWGLALAEPVIELMFTTSAMVVIFAVGVCLSVFAYRKGTVSLKVDAS